MHGSDSSRRHVTLDALQRYFPDGRWAARVQPLPDQGCVFVKNAKAGTSTVVLWLHRIHTGDYAFVPQRTAHREHALPSPGDVGEEKVAAMLDGEAFRFAFVRHPVARVESAYVNKIVQAPDGVLGRRAKLQRVLGLPVDRDSVPTFDQFVAALQLQEPLRMDQHWRPQHLNLMQPLVIYDLVGRVETFADDLARVREMGGLPEASAEVQNQSRRSGGSLFDGRPDLLRKVRDVYAADFEMYGYAE